MKNRIGMTLIMALMTVVAFGDEKKAEDLNDPIAILKKADDASKAAKFVKYQASVKRDGVLGQRVSSAEGTVVLQGWKNNRAEKFRIDAKGKRADSEDTIETAVGGDGENYYVIDHKNKKAYLDLDPAVMGTSGQIGQVLLMLEYVHEAPFSDEINGTKQELKGSKKIGDEDCYEIHVAYSAQGQEADWYFSKKDFLPRGVRRFFKSPTTGQEGSTELTVTKLQVQPKLDKDPFKFELPAGYTQTDDFAP